MTDTNAAPAAVDILRLVGLGRRFRQGPVVLEVLKGIDLTIRRGELVALVGASGSGKSTLLHLAGLLERPSEGQVILDGTDVSSASDGERTRLRRRRLGFVYQFHHLLPEFSALENILLPQMIAGVGKSRARTRAQALLEAVGLSHRMNHRPAELSGGEQQRVAIARALANQPGLLLADEPTGNLDPRTSDMVFQIFHALVREAGLSALIVTHNLELAARMDRVLHLRDGQLTNLEA